MPKQKLVVLSGAGISAESGIKTFRDSDGLWENYSIEEVATPRAWRKNPQLVLDFYNQRRQNILNAQPNSAHLGLASLEKYFDVFIITQNIDDLHERAGSTNVMHLHGEIFKMRSECDSTLIYPIKNNIKIGDLADDGAQLRPHIVWFEEEVPMIDAAIPIVEMADIFIVIGTSLAVYPAAGLVNFVLPNVPIYIIDKSLPEIRTRHKIIPIISSATEGIRELKRILLVD